jgi:hypothetical protein
MSDGSEPMEDMHTSLVECNCKASPVKTHVSLWLADMCTSGRVFCVYYCPRPLQPLTIASKQVAKLDMIAATAPKKPQAPAVAPTRQSGFVSTRCRMHHRCCRRQATWEDQAWAER